MKKLTEQKYWESKYKSNESGLTHNAYKSNLPHVIERLLVPYMHSNQINLITENISVKENSKIVEIGSAPGYFVCELAEILKIEPYGVEYSENGAKVNREVFKMHGFNEENVIYADFFSEDFLKRHENFFDIVISRGFIEHFDSPENAVSAHLRILKKNGYIAVIVPNKTGINRFLSLFFNKDSLHMHNLRIMHIDEFENIFPRNKVSKILAKYFGIFDLYQFNPSLSRKRIHSLAMKLQKVLYILYRMKPKSMNLDSRIFSPMLIFVGRKL